LGSVTSVVRSEHYCPKCKDTFANAQAPPPIAKNIAPSNHFTPTHHVPHYQQPAVIYPAHQSSPTLTEFQMLATITEMGFPYADALRALTTLKAGHHAQITPDLLLNTILEDAEVTSTISAVSAPPPARAPYLPTLVNPFTNINTNAFATTYPINPFTNTNLNINSNATFNTNTTANINTDTFAPFWGAPTTATPVTPVSHPTPAVSTPVIPVTSTPAASTPVTPAARPTTNPNVSSDGSCVVCFNNPINSVLVPCGHLAMCFTCAQVVKRVRNECPVCRRTISAVYQTFHV